MNKTAFVRQHFDLPVKELLALAKKKRIRLTAAHAYTIRTQIRKKGNAAVARTKRLVNSLSTAFAPSFVPKSSLSTTLDTLSRKFVGDLLTALRGASLGDLAGR